MNYSFITGIPTAGKTFLAKNIANKYGIPCFSIDNWREEMKNDPELKKWVDFFWNKDEEEYFRETDCEKSWEFLKNQSEAFWPFILSKIKEIQKFSQRAIFEGVNILPHLAKQNLDFSGIVLLGQLFELTFERNKQSPRWGKTEDLQRREAENFYYCEQPKYQMEAEKYGFKVFTDVSLAEAELIKILGIKK